jgi:hypothetical protein
MQAMTRLAAALNAALFLAACAQTAEQSADAQKAASQPIVTDHPSCNAHPAIFVSPRIARQGATLKLVVEEPVGAYAPRDIPAELVTGWTASPAGQVSLAADGSALTVASNAKAGTDVTLSAKFCGKPITRTIRIVGKDEPVLTGMWRQEQLNCTGETPSEPVRELDIKDNGEFSITYAPFESYRDFWGTTDVNIAAGTLAFNVTGGNRVPEGAKLSGKARLTADGKLSLDGFFLSQPTGAGGQCQYVFAK